MNHIRLLQNIELEVTLDNREVINKYYVSGVLLSAEKLVKLKVDNAIGTYYNIYLSDGTKIFGLDGSVFEVIGTIPTELETIDESATAEDSHEECP